jgi:hypothetical protein
MAKVDAINNFPNPTNKKQLMRFLGMIGFYTKFCSNLYIKMLQSRQQSKTFFFNSRIICLMLIKFF